MALVLPPKKASRGLRSDNVDFLDKFFDFWNCFYHAIPFTFPHFLYMVPQGGQLLDFRSCFFTHNLHRFIVMKLVFHGAVGETCQTAMIETSLKFIDGFCLGVIPVYEICLFSMYYSSFTFVSCMSNSGQEVRFGQF